jgi:glucokinase
VEVVLANDVKAAAAAEARWGALVDCDPGVYLNLGTGLAVAIVCGGRVVDGAHGAAGEIGYNLRSVTDLGRGPHDRVLLEDVVSGRALHDRGSRLAGRDVLPAEVLEAPPDSRTGAVLEEFLAELCFHVVNLAVTLDPARIAVGGGIVRSWGRIGPRLAEALLAGVPFPPELVVAAFPYDAPLVGALALAIDAANRSQETWKRATAKGRT